MSEGSEVVVVPAVLAVTFVTPHSPVAATVTEHAPSSVSEEAQRSPRSERLET